MTEMDEGAIRRVLLVDDDPAIQKIGKAILEHCGCRVVIAGSGREAVDAFTRDKVDIIFLDCHMPEMDGHQTTREIRALESSDRQRTAAKRVPIVALTGLATDEEKDRCLQSGMDDFVGKPFRIAVIQDVLGRWSLPRGQEKGEGASTAATPETPQPTPRVSAAQDGPSVLDIKALDTIASLQPPGAENILLKVIAAYLESSAALLQHIRGAVEGNDADALYRAAHTLKSPSASLGASVFAGMCAELELMGRSGTLEGTRTVLERLEQEYGRVRAALEGHSAMLRS
jgi:CheY-like chemotaxis protein/HPt (histidine-containing phosphotransfer) domain-containing protein